ncbi:hypothetical protein PQ478_09405 [Alkalihalophilus pseudofirmus]|uniref:hypothetical protein n=1 Tax=Alkalihalophilus pseudofirmus TaxID=79885 RepID=UPI00259BBDC3|nr:hypothetical protein [Alkalihalophilus pseudofirmus]WEG18684.1 hypothetical protein PQ478_09405 [Alkalihalophilus pseudofirmus]
MAAYQLKDSNDYSYYTYSQLSQAREGAEELATKLKTDIFIYKVTEELLELSAPDVSSFTWD